MYPPFRRPFAALLAVAGLISGCTVGPNYRAPEVPVEDAFRSPTWTQGASTSAAVTNSPVAAARWWQALQDPELGALMERAVTSNLDVKVAGARVRQARAELAYTAGGQYPQVNVDAGYSHNRLSKTAAPYNAFDIPGFPWEYNQYQAGFDASWELDVFGGVRRGVEAARADLAASAAD